MPTLDAVLAASYCGLMADQNREPGWDERMDAMRMNLELMGYRIEDSRKESQARMKEFQENIDASRKEFDARIEVSRQEFREEMDESRKEFRERSGVLMQAVEDLMVASGPILRRAEKIERRIA